MELAKPNIPIAWHRTKLPHSLLEELNTRSDAKGYIQSLGYLGICSATGILAFIFWQNETWWWFALALFLHGTVTSFYINAVHELVHGTVFKTPWLNELFAHIFSFLGIINPKMFWYSHSEHHKYTLHPPDDLEVVVPIYHSTTHYFSSFLFNAHFYKDFTSNLRYCFGKFVGAWEPILVPENAPQRRKSVIHWSRWMLLGHLILIITSIATGLWIIPILVSFSGAYGAWLFFLLNNTQHSGLTENINDFRLNCRTININPLSRFLYWHMNWHIEHHMYAAVPCYNLHKLHKAIRHELPRTPGIIETWVEIAYIQYRRMRDDDYRFLPQLPDENGKFKDESSRLQQIRRQADQRLAANQNTVVKPSLDGKPYRRWECKVCAFVYDEARGMPEEGISPGTRWEDIPEDWHCPDCGVAKAEFQMMLIGDDKVINAAQLDPEIMKNHSASEAAIVIIGSGIAGYGLARELHRQKNVRPVILITRDGGESYSKPTLSNALAAGKSAADLINASASEMATQLNLRVITHCSVDSIDRHAKCVKTNKGDINYADLILAIGADPLRLSITGDASTQILHVNDLNDFRSYQEKLSRVGKHARVLLIGGGLIGCEFANDLARAGHKTCVVELGRQLLGRLVPEKIATLLQSSLEEKGVRYHFGVSVSRVTQSHNGLCATLTDGRTEEADVIVSAVGLRPRMELAAQAGLSTQRGIIVDEFLTTSDPHIYAIGDCAEVNGQLLPYIQPITYCVKALAATLCGTTTKVVYPVMPVAVKTPDFPLIISPPSVHQQGEWSLHPHQGAWIARFHNDNGSLRGFVLTGEARALQEELSAEMAMDAASDPQVSSKHKPVHA